MRCLKAATALFIFLLTTFSNAGADDFGQRNDVGTVRADAHTLLAHRARLAKVDPKDIAITDVVVARDQAVLSWDIGKQHGFMGLVRQNNRWWDALDKTALAGTQCWSTLSAFPLRAGVLDGFAPSRGALPGYGFSSDVVTAAAAHNADVHRYGTLAGCTDDVYEVKPDLSIKVLGAPVQVQRSETSGYDLSIRYAPNNALAGARFTLLYVRPPTAAEFLPYPTPYRYVSDAVMFFDITIDGPKPISFQKGTMFDVWFPFVLDDTLKYSLSFGGGQDSVGPVTGSIFDNVLHFELPSFTAIPGKELMGEIDGDTH